MKERWQTAVLVVAVMLLGCILGQSFLPRAQAQVEAGAGRVAVVMGQERQGYAPIVLVDSLEQTVVVYEYSYGARRLKLESARTYRFDKQLPEFKVGEPSVRQVQDMLQRR
jgi:hypothetical protein